MNTPLIRRPDGNGASAEAVPSATGAAGAADGYPLPAGRRISGVFMTWSFLAFSFRRRAMTVAPRHW